MPFAAVILVEPAFPINLGSAMRVVANFGVPTLDLVRPGVDPDDPEVCRWACGAHHHVATRIHDDFPSAAGKYRVLVATASGRGRTNLPVLTPSEAAAALSSRPLHETALVFGNETRGMRREDVDRCDMVVRIPTVPEFPVLNLTQAIAILLGSLAIALEPLPPTGPPPAPQSAVERLMAHLEKSLLTIGFLDPVNPQRTLRKIRRMLGRAGVTENEVAILHGICRQMEWAARTNPADASALPDKKPRPGHTETQDP
ncbi:MAG: hypothetical protein GXP48_08875 [Acidobacteria bacterium]|nr:hypothetical protein [Acidobacteriota bacterium]